VLSWPSRKQGARNTSQIVESRDVLKPRARHQAADLACLSEAHFKSQRAAWFQPVVHRGQYTPVSRKAILARAQG